MNGPLELFVLLLPLIVLAFGGFVYFLAKHPPSNLEPGE
jgi:hypothetical protein